jgi:hypothetical protein
MTSPGVYVGVWRDYSAAGESLILTLPTKSAGYVISALALLVSLSGTSFWLIVAYILHQTRVPTKTSVHPTHLQLQVLLRNAQTPVAALLSAVKIGHAWSGANVPILKMLLPIVIPACLIALLFTLASVFITFLTIQSGDNILVLATPGQCGYMTSNYSSAFSLSEAFGDTFGWQTAAALRGRAYAKARYSVGDSQVAIESYFPLSSLPFNTSQVPCPLPENRCVFRYRDSANKNSAIAFDTGLLDAVSHLGINAPAADSLLFRKKTTCMPVRTNDLWDFNFTDTDGKTYIAFRAGKNYGPGNITVTYSGALWNIVAGYITG